MKKRIFFALTLFLYFAKGCDNKDNTNIVKNLIFINLTGDEIKNEFIFVKYNNSDTYKNIDNNIPGDSSLTIRTSKEGISEIKIINLSDTNMINEFTFQNISIEKSVFIGSKKYLIQSILSNNQSQAVIINYSSTPPAMRNIVIVNYTNQKINKNEIGILYDSSPNPITEYWDKDLAAGDIDTISKFGKLKALTLLFRDQYTANYKNFIPDKPGKRDTIFQSDLTTKSKLYITVTANSNNGIYKVIIRDSNLANNIIPRKFFIINQTNSYVDLSQLILYNQSGSLSRSSRPINIPSNNSRMSFYGNLPEGLNYPMENYVIELDSENNFLSITPIAEFHENNISNYAIGIELSNAKDN